MFFIAKYLIPDRQQSRSYIASSFSIEPTRAGAPDSREGV
jgi:hypothetical protein